MCGRRSSMTSSRACRRSAQSIPTAALKRWENKSKGMEAEWTDMRRDQLHICKHHRASITFSFRSSLIVPYSLRVFVYLTFNLSLPLLFFLFSLFSLSLPPISSPTFPPLSSLLSSLFLSPLLLLYRPSPSLSPTSTLSKTLLCRLLWRKLFIGTLQFILSFSSSSSVHSPLIRVNVLLSFLTPVHFDRII